MIREPKNPHIQEILKKHQKPLIKWLFIIVFIIFTGIILSVYYNEWHWFSRSGSLVVICGLLIAKWDVTSKIEEEKIDFLDPVIKRIFKEKDEAINSRKQRM